MRLAVEQLLEIRYRLRTMWFKVENFSNILGDNKTVIMNMQFPSNTLKNKQSYVAYHKSREVLAASFSVAGHIDGMENPLDILTKPVSPSEFYKNTGPVILGVIPIITSALISVSYRTKYKEPPVKVVNW